MCGVSLPTPQSQAGVEDSEFPCLMGHLQLIVLQHRFT
uniref:Uncharacterized protein n=1 Tax=Anguilla anguilla TaxID=7936 RepID=A0A0E9VDP2_ANGAN